MIVCALGTMSDELEKWIRKISVEYPRLRELQYVQAEGLPCENRDFRLSGQC